MKTSTIIEFTGMPNSGKTTLIRRLSEELPKKHGLTVQVQREDAEIVPPEIPKKTWDRNVWITFGQLQSIVQAHHSNSDIVLLDRGLFNAVFWAEFMFSQTIATYEQSNGMQNILMQMFQNLQFHPDYLFLIDVSVAESLRRHALVENGSVYSKPDFLNSYRNKFFRFFKDYIEGNEEYQIIPMPSFYLNTTDMNSDEVFKNVEEQILKICSR